MRVPGLAVVGRPNKGKSSIVATLARDDSVYIDKRAGSTRRTQQFPMVVGDDTLYVLYDTPGMQRSRQVLEWLQANCADAAGRPDAVRRFYGEHRDDPRFVDECEMLEPIMEGAGIIYVVDGSCPFGREYEPEMEVLRWTGSPSLALINPIQSQDYVQDWQNGLNQYFRTVRVFDAHHAEFAKQLELLELFGHLDTGWRAAMTQAVQALESEREQQHRAASALVSELIVKSMTYQVSQAVPRGIPAEPVKTALYERYTRHLEAEEQRCRKRLEELFYYRHLRRSETGLAWQKSDLFNVENWYLWGLSKRSLVSVATATGAVLGGSSGMAVDAVTGGLLGGLGTAIGGMGGAVAGGAGALKYADRIADITVRGIPTGGETLSIGPSPNPNFPFVLLGRALEHHRLLARRTHAHREVMNLDGELLADVSEKDRKALNRVFTAIRKDKDLARQQLELADMVFGQMIQVDS